MLVVGGVGGMGCRDDDAAANQQDTKHTRNDTPMKPLDIDPTDEQIQDWINEHAIQQSKEPVTAYVARKAARHAADIELRAWSRLLDSMKSYGVAVRFEAERRPRPPKAVIEYGGYTYHLAPGQ